MNTAGMLAMTAVLIGCVACIGLLVVMSTINRLDRKLNTIAELQAQKIIDYNRELSTLHDGRDIDFAGLSKRISAVTEDLPELINGLIQAKLESVGQGKPKPVTPKRVRSWSEILKDAEAAQTPEQAREERVSKALEEAE